jgi:hypothetical protein
MREAHTVPDFDPTALANHNDVIKDNILALEAGVEREYATLKGYREQLLSPKPGGFSRDALERGIEGCKRNIAAIEAVIDKERMRISDNREKIQRLVNIKQRCEIAAKGVRVEIERDVTND